MINELLNTMANHNNFMEENRDELKNISQFNECEYVFIDDLNNEKVRENIFENKTLLSFDEDELIMLESEDFKADNNNHTKLNYSQQADLAIITKEHNINLVEDIVDEDTIVTKYLGNDVMYMEDSRNELSLIVTECEKLILEGKGVNTKLTYYDRGSLKKYNIYK